MDRNALLTLAQFCASQQAAFDAGCWIIAGATDPLAYGLAAKYLSMTSWYGHEDELERIAATLCPALARRDGFDRELRACGFDLQFLSSSVRYRIATRVTERRSKAELALP